ncbi:serine carboxypeptidase-like 40 [Nicotiana sylvestris]|uniref:Carboxypeptidase n=1 Tax=Nicotiana sylvestris TaxID=4096 RepID=A0A1U7XRB3_NICSY|nr:PREDICTED: serine carboxypeptidase-like 40 [Nicotiana sylvestris]
MEKITFFLLLTLTLSQIVSSSLDRSHSHGLSKLYLTKLLKKDSAIDKNSHFSSALDYLELDKVVLPQEGLKHKDRIKRLSGQPPVKFKQYGGYVTVNEFAGRALFYYFVEAENSRSLPLLLWLNGGPGCSSIAYGAMEELGPFRVHSNGKTLYRNHYAWNHEANVLFLESPAGVGFSYSNTSSDVKSNGDRNTAIDNVIFLLNWIQRFPEYKNRDFYIAGESYAGHFVPQLAQTILHHNKLAKKTLLNLKGIMIGNAVINYETDRKGMYEYHASHALIPDEILEQIERYCNFSDKALPQSQECDNAIDIAIADTEPIDVYNIYAPLCSNSELTLQPKKTSQVIDPCSDDYVIAYMNRPDVQKLLHANVTKIKYNWQPCSDVIESWTDSPLTIIPLLKELMANGVRLWMFRCSGDTDGIVPVTSTKKSIKKMKLPIKTAWYPWFHNDEVGGYAQIYVGNLTFATVRGAGHQVPSYQPARALSLVKHFLAGTELPNSPKHKNNNVVI